MGSTPRSMTNGGQNMQELDSLLEDLNRSRYSGNNNVEPRPSVDVLLNELSTAVVQTWVAPFVLLERRAVVYLVH